MAASQFNSQANQLKFDGRTRVGGPQSFGPFTEEVEYRFLLIQGDVVVKGSGTGSGGTWDGTTYPDQPPLQEGPALAIGLAFVVENLNAPGFTTFSWSEQLEVVNG
jgi:hypothetical protein